MIGRTAPPRPVGRPPKRKPQGGPVPARPRGKNVDSAGIWTPGIGKAHLNADFWSEPFNCRMVGTFNIKTCLNLENFSPAFVNYKKAHKFWLVRLNDERYGWAMRWTGSKMAPTTFEIISKTPFPESYRQGNLKIEVLEKWPDENIKRWASRIHFFQTFEWGPQEANSKMVWDAVNHVSWPEKTVLDIGCNFGFHAFQASRAGARVTGWDANPNVLPVARTINDHIEMSDVIFLTGRFPSDSQKWDIIFCFSVIHQGDPKYTGLQTTCQGLKKAAREKVFLELIVPALQGNLGEAEIDKIVGGRPLLKYRHHVRCERKIYELEGGK